MTDYIIIDTTNVNHWPGLLPYRGRFSVVGYPTREAAEERLKVVVKNYSSKGLSGPALSVFERTGPPHHTCCGSVRGPCRIAHRSAEAARRCIDRDRNECARVGGYSDRQVWVVSSERASAHDVRDGLRYSWLQRNADQVLPDYYGEE